MFNSGLLIRIFFGAQWMDLKPVMFVISCSLLFNIDGRLADCYLRSLGMTKQQFYLRVFEFVLKTVGIVACFKAGILGVAISVVITNFIAKIVKIVYIGRKIDLDRRQVMTIILSSWRYLLLMLPVCIAAYVLFPQGWIWDITMAAVFAIVAILIFILMPHFVGEQYYKEVYIKIISFLQNKLRKK